jgi:hypothetical protein
VKAVLNQFFRLSKNLKRTFRRAYQSPKRKKGKLYLMPRLLVQLAMSVNLKM